MNFIFFFILAFKAMACDNVDLYQIKSHIYDQLPITDQKNSSICYAHAGSDLVNFYAMDEQISSTLISHPYWMAYKHKEKKIFHWAPTKLDYSAIAWAISDIKSAGFCDYEKTTARLKKLLMGKKLEESDLFEFYELYHDFLKTKKNRDGNQTEKFKNYVHKKFFKDPPYWLKAWNKENIYELVNVLPTSAWQKKRFKFYQTKLFPHCASEVGQLPSLPLWKSYLRETFGPKALEAATAETLSAAQAPVAIGYCSIILEDESYRLSVRSVMNCSPHYSTLVASRKSYQQCEYLLRNSYGKEYWMKTNYNCACKLKTASVTDYYDCNRKSFNESLEEVIGCWIPANALFTNTFDIGHFTSK
ncbi:MAG: hypothetical protein JNM93_04295 [Bacteriovoracaceae bacterium]|nr:hypothetical protein [Bacteriovoracaceae bacterium]